MGDMIFDGVKVTLLSCIPTEGGDVMHALKATDEGFAGFGEAYFSCIHPGAIKAWKRHTRMTMNLVVPVGHIRFVFAADVAGPFLAHDLGPAIQYARLTVNPGVWFGFQGRGESNSILLNLASIVHDYSEAETRGLDQLRYDWN